MKRLLTEMLQPKYTCVTTAALLSHAATDRDDVQITKRHHQTLEPKAVMEFLVSCACVDTVLIPVAKRRCGSSINNNAADISIQTRQKNQPGLVNSSISNRPMLKLMFA